MLIYLTVVMSLLRLSFLMMTFWCRHQEFAYIMYEERTSRVCLYTVYEGVYARRMNLTVKILQHFFLHSMAADCCD
jgi:hypothetical protein